MQFTCDFKLAPANNGRADVKAIKTLVNQVSPKRLVVLRGGAADVKMVSEIREANSHDKDRHFFVPKINTTISFDGRCDRIRLLIPQSLLPSTIKQVRAPSGSSYCSVFTISGTSTHSSYSLHDCAHTLKYSGTAEPKPSIASTQSLPTVLRSDETEGDIEIYPVEDDEEADDSFRVDLDAPNHPEREKGQLIFDGLGMGTISVGEVQLKTLKEALESAGMSVEYRLGTSGSMLVCANQVVIRKDGENDFVIEGPANIAYYEARKILYAQFAQV